jgi:hypothetical protein
MVWCRAYNWLLLFQFFTMGLGGFMNWLNWYVTAEGDPSKPHTLYPTPYTIYSCALYERQLRPCALHPTRESV